MLRLLVSLNSHITFETTKGREFFLRLVQWPFMKFYDMLLFVQELPVRFLKTKLLRFGVCGGGDHMLGQDFLSRLLLIKSVAFAIILLRKE
jgi:hypothetical protein